MKQFFILLVFTLLVAPASFAQSGKKPRFIAPLIAEEHIRHVIITGNVNVLLVEDVPSNVGVKLPSSDLGKLDIRVEGENLYISASSSLGANERAEAYVTVNDLVSLELKGNVVATSKGVLYSRQLQVITNEKAVVALRNDKPVTVNSPASYQIVKGKEYYSIFAGNL